MSALTVEPELTIHRSGSPTAVPQRPVPGRSRPARPGRGTGRATGPQLRPDRPVPAPSLRRTSAARLRACSVVVAPTSATWRLTDRAIALILVVMATIAIAAVMVVGLTALQVTGPSYQASGHSQLAQP